MRLRLKEEPREWRNFAFLCCAISSLLASAGYWRKTISALSLAIIVGGAVLVALAALLQPKAFRGFYRAAMRISFHLGQVLGKVVLAVFYLFLLTPLGWALRLAGKDFLELRRDPKQSTHWKKARRTGKLNTQF